MIEVKAECPERVHVFTMNGCTEFDWEPSVDSADLGVAVENGVVTLTNHVPTFAQKVKAEQAVQRMRGVRAIA